MRLVLDPSAVIALAMNDEPADYAARVLDRLQVVGAVVPPIFWYEIRNVLIVSERRGRIAAETTSVFLAMLAELPIEVAPLPTDLGVLDLARRHGLSVYDAAYLELAIRAGAPLATLDARLREAAKAAGVSVFGGVGVQ